MPPSIDPSKPKCQAIFTTLFDEWFSAQSEKVQKRLSEVITWLEGAGEALAWPHCESIENYNGDELVQPRELRKEVDRNPYRIFYVFSEDKKEAWLLSGGYKTGNPKRFVKEMTRQAEKAHRLHKEELKEEQRKKAQAEIEAPVLEDLEERRHQ